MKNHIKFFFFKYIYVWNFITSTMIYVITDGDFFCLQLGSGVREAGMVGAKNYDTKKNYTNLNCWLLKLTCFDHIKLCDHCKSLKLSFICVVSQLLSFICSLAALDPKSKLKSRKTFSQFAFLPLNHDQI